MPVRKSDDPEILNLKGLHLYHTDVSNCSMRVRLLLEEKGLKWTSHHLNLVKRENLEDWYFRIHPNGLVPALVDDGVPVTDSIDILYYLEEKYPTPSFLPQSASELAKVKSWLDLAGRIHVKGVKTFVYGAAGLVTKKRSDMDHYAEIEPDKELVAFHWKSLDGFPPEEIEAAIKILQEAFGRLERRLKDHDYLVGESYSLADITWVVQYVLLTRKGFEFSTFPHIQTWVKRLNIRPSYKLAITDWQP